MGRREENAERTKSALTDNALRLFRDRGYDAVSVEQITQAAGVAKGTFYSYFETKSDIIVEEFWKIDRYYEWYASRNLARWKTAEERLLAFTGAQMRYVRDEVGVESLQILYANQVAGAGAERVIVDSRRRWYAIIEDIVAFGRDRGEFLPGDDPRRIAELVNRSVRSVFLEWCLSDGRLDLVDEGLKHVEDWILPILKRG